jgi:hypothetical protein
LEVYKEAWEDLQSEELLDIHVAKADLNNEI